MTIKGNVPGGFASGGLVPGDGGSEKDAKSLADALGKLAQEHLKLTIAKNPTGYMTFTDPKTGGAMVLPISGEVKMAFEPIEDWDSLFPKPTPAQLHALVVVSEPIYPKGITYIEAAFQEAEAIGLHFVLNGGAIVLYAKPGCARKLTDFIEWMSELPSLERAFYAWGRLCALPGEPAYA